MASLAFCGLNKSIPLWGCATSENVLAEVAFLYYQDSDDLILDETLSAPIGLFLV